MKLILSLTLMFIGLYFILTEFIEPPSDAPIRALKARSQNNIGILKKLNKYIALYISKYTELDNENESRLQKLLDTLGIPQTAKEFECSRRASVIMYCGVGIVIMPISPLVCIIAILSGIAVYSIKRKELERKLKERREEIELELPQFSATINQELTFSSNVRLILERYLRVYGNTMKAELEHTLTNISTSNVEQALSAFSIRIGSAKLNDLLRGLNAVNRGEDQRAYFEMLTEELIKNGNAIIRKKQSDKPNKMRIWQLFLFIGFAILVSLPMIIQMITGLQSLMK